MNLVRIGQLVVNLDNVTCIRDLSDRDGLGQVTRKLYQVEFDKDHSVEVSAHYDDLAAWLADALVETAPSP
jgi:hypothetical protein